MSAKLLKKKLKKIILKNKNDLNLSLIRLTCSLGRANSFEFSEKSKQKLFKKLRNKIRINKKRNSAKYEGDYKRIDEDNSLDEDIDSDDSRGFSLHPNNVFIFIFDIMIIIANLYTFIFIPLRITKNEDIRGPDKVFGKFILYFIDIIYFLDIIISLFRGFYDYKMEIVRNNKQILINYLKKDFLMDLIEVIPMNLKIKIRIFHNT